MQTGAQLQVIGEDFSYAADQAQWQFRGRHGNKSGLPYPALRGAYQLANASACIAALDALRTQLPVTINDIRGGLLQAQAAGRFRYFRARPVVILDVAHNPHAAERWPEIWRQWRVADARWRCSRCCRTRNIAGVIGAVGKHIDCWLIAGIEGKRGANDAVLRQQLQAAGVTAPVTACPSIAAAYAQACDMAKENDRILVFGSFYTVAAGDTCTISAQCVARRHKKHE